MYSMFSNESAVGVDASWDRFNETRIAVQNKAFYAMIIFFRVITSSLSTRLVHTVTHWFPFGFRKEPAIVTKMEYSGKNVSFGIHTVLVLLYFFS